MTNCCANIKIKRFLKKGNIKINNELDLMNILKHIKGVEILNKDPMVIKKSLQINVDADETESDEEVKSDYPQIEQKDIETQNVVEI